MINVGRVDSLLMKDAEHITIDIIAQITRAVQARVSRDLHAQK